MSEPQPKNILLWTRAYRIAAVAAVILLVCVTAGGIRASRKEAPLIEPERINPNTAPLGSLVRLPGIGKARALDILHFRQTLGTGVVVFQSANDLQAIRGIGPKTVENIAPWLTFEEEY